MVNAPALVFRPIAADIVEYGKATLGGGEKIDMLSAVAADGREEKRVTEFRGALAHTDVVAVIHGGLRPAVSPPATSQVAFAAEASRAAVVVLPAVAHCGRMIHPMETMSRWPVSPVNGIPGTYCSRVIPPGRRAAEDVVYRRGG